MKTILLLTLTALMGTGCVITPDGNFSGGVLFDGGATVGVDVDYAPRVYNGTRSGVTVWLHPSHVVADAYPIAQEHCARWGFFAQPSFNWTATASIERRLNYSCIGHRPVLSGPHIIIGSPFYRNHYRHWHNNSRRPYYGRNTYNGRRHDRGYNNRVYTPKPVPRHRPNYKSPRRRGTFGRIFSPKETTVQRGKPWEHNRNKNRGISLPTQPDTTVQRGKPWEHNRNKNKGSVAPRLELPTATKRKTFGGGFKPAKVYKSPGFKRKDFRKKKVTTSYKTKTFGKIRPKKTNRRVKKGPLTL